MARYQYGNQEATTKRDLFKRQLGNRFFKKDLGNRLVGKRTSDDVAATDVLNRIRVLPQVDERSISRRERRSGLPPQVQMPTIMNIDRIIDRIIEKRVNNQIE